jgi:cytochrome c oxidase subunit 1
MYLTGMGTRIATFFQTTTMMISIPSVIILTSLFISLWGASIRFTVPMLFALGFLPMFGIGGLTGLPLGFNVSDIYLHDTYYVIAHFHYIVAPGTIFALFAGIYYWYPKVTGRLMNEFWGRAHFGLSFMFMNAVFLPMFFQGLAGMSRRMYDGGLTYAAVPPGNGSAGVPGLSNFVTADLNRAIFAAAICLALSQIPFIVNFFWSIKHGKKISSDNPWEATTLEWQTPTPPPHGNFERAVEVFRGPYEYSVPGEARDYTTQNEPETAQELTHGNPVRS